MEEYERTWRQERRAVDLEPEVPTGRALVWPTIIMVLVVVYILWQLVR